MDEHLESIYRHLPIEVLEAEHIRVQERLADLTMKNEIITEIVNEQAAKPSLD